VAVKITHYDIGDLWTPQATFTVANVNTDPTNLTVTQQDAAGAETVLLNNVLVSTLTGSSTPVAKTATGIFKLNPGISLTAAGYWFVKFTGTGAAAAAEQQQAIVDPDEFTTDAGVNANALVGLAETKDWLQKQNIDTADDLELVRVINDISARFYDEAGREFKVFSSGGTLVSPPALNPQVRLFDVDEVAIWNRAIRVGDLTSFTAVRILDELGNLIQTVATSDCISLPRLRKPWEPIRALRFTQNIMRLWGGLYPYVVEVTGVWGFPSVPGNVREAILDAVVSVMDRDVEHYRQDFAPQPGGTGTNVIMLGARPQILSLPPEALAVAQFYRDQLVG
jgi:hypothetical protein